MSCQVNPYKYSKHPKIFKNLKKEEPGHLLVDKKMDIVWGFLIWFISIIFIFPPLFQKLIPGYTAKIFIPITLALVFWATISWRRNKRREKYLKEILKQNV